MPTDWEIVGGSYKDPSGFVFKLNGEIYRHVSVLYKDNYDLLLKSGLYEKLFSHGLTIPFEEVHLPDYTSKNTHVILKPRPLAFVSYPYEWCFSQLRDAALTTLAIQRMAIDHGMSLKDASAYNIQFVDGAPLLIDTLSFERYDPHRPWIAYRQFCQHFLAPLALMAYRDSRFGLLLREFLDGLPLDFVSRLLPMHSWLRVGLVLHIHIHSRAQKYYSSRQPSNSLNKKRYDERKMRGLIDSLESTILSLKIKRGEKDWSSYYEEGLSAEYLRHKKAIVKEYSTRIGPTSIWDIGANIGLFGRVASGGSIPVYAFDSDLNCCEKNYLQAKENKEKNILPLVLDLMNPSPALGWANKERDPLLDRLKPDLVLALALIHHLAISNNVPFGRVAALFRSIAHYLVIEFIPKSDPRVKDLLRSREDIFLDYSKEGFESEFAKFFSTLESSEVQGSGRIIYLMKSH